jgi:CO/xanthine dehydrogenase FAD-binding subunit
MRYEAPSTVAEAANLLAGADGLARVLAGGTDLLVRMRSGMEEPDLIVDIKRIDGMRDIVQENGGWRVGAAVSGAEMREHAALSADYPGVVEAVDLIGSTQIQGRATMAGNLCNSSPAADSVPAMVAAGASVNIAGPSGKRQVPVGEFCTGPGKNVLAKGELVTSISLPAKAAGMSDAYLRFIPRTEMDIAVVGCGVSLTMVGGTCTAARVALGAVGPTVINVEAGAAALVGSKVDDAALEDLAAACSAAASPISDKRGTVAFRTHVAGVLARRAAVIARDRAEA